MKSHCFEGDMKLDRLLLLSDLMICDTEAKTPAYVKIRITYSSLDISNNKIYVD